MNILIISYRISGNDGVSLECEHWRQILERMGHKVTYLAGQLDRAGIVMPELHFQWPAVMEIHDRVIYDKGKYRSVESQVFDIAGTIEGKLRHFLNGQRKYDLIIVPNIFSLPMHFPLSVALSRIITDLNIPTIARHHDFWWERQRFLKSSLFPFFGRWFPPHLPCVKHVVINSIAQKELKARTGLGSIVIWDSFDFANEKLRWIDNFSGHFKADFGIYKDDIVFLLATRIVPRKRVELAIEFMQKLNNPKALLVISGHAGDEGREYFKKIKKLLKSSKLRYKIIGDWVNSKRRVVRELNSGEPKRRRIYNLWDAYRNCDFILYPTKKEGFGNQFVEGVFFKKPIILTPYPVYQKDIKPLGFQIVEFSDKFYKKAVEKVNQLIANEELKTVMVEKNFELGAKYLSYDWAAKKLEKLLLKTENPRLKTEN